MPFIRPASGVPDHLSHQSLVSTIPVAQHAEQLSPLECVRQIVHGRVSSRTVPAVVVRLTLVVRVAAVGKTVAGSGATETRAVRAVKTSSIAMAAVTVIVAMVVSVVMAMMMMVTASVPMWRVVVPIATFSGIVDGFREVFDSVGQTVPRAAATVRAPHTVVETVASVTFVVRVVEVVVRVPARLVTTSKSVAVSSAPVDAQHQQRVDFLHTRTRTHYR